MLDAEYGAVHTAGTPAFVVLCELTVSAFLKIFVA